MEAKISIYVFENGFVTYKSTRTDKDFLIAQVWKSEGIGKPLILYKSEKIYECEERSMMELIS